jgi:hypothetical protein
MPHRSKKFSINFLTHAEKTTDKTSNIGAGIHQLGESEEEVAGCLCLPQFLLLEQRHIYRYGASI